MARHAKVAFSIQPELLARVEQMRLRSGQTRSAVIVQALERITAEQAHTDAVERYIAAYRKQPETVADVHAARRLARRTLSRLSWR